MLVIKLAWTQRELSFHYHTYIQVHIHVMAAETLCRNFWQKACVSLQKHCWISCFRRGTSQQEIRDLLTNQPRSHLRWLDNKVGQGGNQDTGEEIMSPASGGTRSPKTCVFKPSETCQTPCGAEKNIKFKANLKGKVLNEEIFQLCWDKWIQYRYVYIIYILPLTTRILTFL